MNALPKTMAEVEAGMARGLHVGAQLYVSLRGQVICDAAVGLARPATPDRPAAPMTPDSITLWLSAGKPITAVAIAQLWERGRLDLDDPVAKHIPEFAAHGKEAITIRHILTHTAPLRLADTGWPNATWEQMIQRINVMRPEPRWTSGRTAGYSAHVTWYVLAEIVQRLSGKPFPDYLRQHVFQPAGMPDTYVAMTPAEQAATADHLAITQVTEKGSPTDLGTETPAALTTPRPSGSLRGPARDLARFYETLLARPPLTPSPGTPGEGWGEGSPSTTDRARQAGEGEAPSEPRVTPSPAFRSAEAAPPRMLLPQTIEALTARHRVNTLDKTFGAIIDWGLGFIINSAHYGREDAPYQYGPHASPRTFGHAGNQSTAAFADPEHALVAVAIFNGLPGEKEHQPRMSRTLTAIYEDLGLASSAVTA